MRTIIDLPEELRRAVDEARSVEGISRAELIRRALHQYLRQSPRRSGKADVFGLWRDRRIDGREYQEQRRAEWDQRP